MSASVPSIELKKEENNITSLYISKPIFTNNSNTNFICRVSIWFFIPISSSGDDITWLFVSTGQLGELYNLGGLSMGPGQSTTLGATISIGASQSLLLNTSLTGSGTIIPPYSYICVLETL